MAFKNLRLLLAVLCCFVIPITAQARGGGGGGASRGGGGASRGGGFSAGGGNSRGSSNVSRSPSMSRSVPSPSFSQRSAAPQAQNRSSVSRPSTGASINRAGAPGTASRPNARAPGTSQGLRTPPSSSAAFNSRSSFQQPSRGQLDSFLNGSPRSSASTSRAASASSSGPTAGQGGGSRTYETEKGGTVTVGGGSRSGTTEGGINVGGAAGGIKIETAGGHTVVRGTGGIGATDGQNKAFAAGSRTGVETAAGGKALAGSGVRGATDGTNSAIRAGGAAGIQDAAGNKAVAARGGYANSSGYRQGGSVTARQNQWGYTAVNARAGYGAGGTGQVALKTAVRGPAGNVVSGGRGASFVNGQFVGGRAYTAVNGNFTRWGYFTPAYFVRYPNAWFPGKWAIVGSAWARTTWAVTGSYCGCEGSGTYYDYEENVTYEDGNVMYEGEPIATTDEYYEQAETIADAGGQTQDEEWLPLGVFAVIAEDDQTNTDKVIQLALNKEGVIRGNFQDMLTEQVTLITGSVDKESERVALKLEGNDSLVMEIGLYNLTNDEVPALVHFDADRREPRTLIRLKNPEEQSGK